MRRTAARALIFAAALLAVSLAADLLLTALGAPVHGGTRRFVMFRVALHGASFALSAAGAMLGFALLRSHAIKASAIASMGAVLGLFTSAVVQAGIKAAAYAGIATWLMVGSALVAFLGGRVLGSRQAARGESPAG